MNFSTFAVVFGIALIASAAQCVAVGNLLAAYDAIGVGGLVVLVGIAVRRSEKRDGELKYPRSVQGGRVR